MVNLKNILDSLDAGIMITDINLNINTVNKALLKMLKKQSSELINKNLLQIPFLKDLEKEDVIRIKLEDNSYLVKKLPITEGGINLGFLIIFNDITKEKERTENIIFDFITKVSHEMRTPLSVMKGYITMMLTDPTITKEERKEILKTMEKECERLERIIENVLDTARIETGQIRYKPQKINLKDTLSHTISLFDRKIKEKNLSFEEKIEDIEITADPTLLSQAILNLLDNAIKFTPAGGRIWLHAQRSGNQVRIEVGDTGSGIPRDILPNIFDRFYRAEDKAHTLPGLGLGLYITREIVEMHRGRIEVESEEGKGTVFRIYLPYE